MTGQKAWLSAEASAEVSTAGNVPALFPPN